MIYWCSPCRPKSAWKFRTKALRLKVFADRLPYKAVVVFTDNKGALGSLNGCIFESAYGLKLVDFVWEIDEGLHAFISTSQHQP